MRDVLRTYLELRRLHRRSMAALEQWRGRLAGRTVFLLGTGPSLVRTPVERMRGEPVIFLNNAYKLRDRVGADCPVYLCTDFLRLREIRPDLEALPGLKLCSTDRVAAPGLPIDLYQPPLHFLMPKVAWLPEPGRVRPHVMLHGFEPDLRRGLYLGHSVVFSAIQVAHFLGASRVVLVGIDMDYAAPGGSYYDPTVRDNWTPFTYEAHARDHLVLARDALAARGSALLNATVGGRIDVLPRIVLQHCVAPPDASVVVDS